MLSERDLSAAIGSTAHGPDGEKIGTVESFFVDDRTGAPTWVAVSTGLFGTRHSVVPATEATFTDGLLQLPVSKDAVKHAPHVGGDHLSPEEEAELRRHYGIGTGGVAHPVAAGPPAGTAVADPGTTPVPPPATGHRTAVGQAAPPPAPQHAGQHAVADVGRQATDGAMTRSEEQLRVGTQQVAATRVRVVKYVVTEEVQVTVPIRREEIRIEEVPLDAPEPAPGESLVPAGAAGGAPAGGAVGGVAGGLPQEIVLHAERPVVGVEVVPVERVRLRTEVVQGEERITDQVQREQIVVDQTTTGQTTASQPGVGQPGVGQPGVAQPGVAQPGVAQPTGQAPQVR